MTTKKSSAKKTYPTKTGKKSATPPSGRWSGKVDTDSTHPDHGLFLQSAPKIARALATKRASPKGPVSGMQMLNFYINRAGKSLPRERVATLKQAKEILSGIIAKKKGEMPAKPASKKSSAKESSAKKSTSQ